jgi:hypothetical protein
MTQARGGSRRWDSNADVDSAGFGGDGSMYVDARD